eukprot:gene2142-2432_t
MRGDVICDVMHGESQKETGLVSISKAKSHMAAKRRKVCQINDDINLYSFRTKKLLKIPRRAAAATRVSGQGLLSRADEEGEKQTEAVGLGLGVHVIDIEQGDEKEYDVCFCDCISDPRILLSHGLWPVSPSKPVFAIEVQLKDFLECFFLESQVKHMYNSLSSNDTFDKYRYFKYRLQNLRTLCPVVSDATVCPACPKGFPCVYDDKKLEINNQPSFLYLSVHGFVVKDDLLAPDLGLHQIPEEYSLFSTCGKCSLYNVPVERMAYLDVRFAIVKSLLQMMAQAARTHLVASIELTLCNTVSCSRRRNNFCGIFRFYAGFGSINRPTTPPDVHPRVFGSSNGVVDDGASFDIIRSANEENDGTTSGLVNRKARVEDQQKAIENVNGINRRWKLTDPCARHSVGVVEKQIRDDVILKLRPLVNRTEDSQGAVKGPRQQAGVLKDTDYIIESSHEEDDNGDSVIQNLIDMDEILDDEIPLSETNYLSCTDSDDFNEGLDFSLHLSEDSD